MGAIIFRYGAMGASKTANLLMMRYNYIEKGKSAILLKPTLENRDGDTIIKSRIGLSAECVYVEDYIKNPEKYDCIIVDECQFLTTEVVDELVKIADSYDSVLAFYGLKTNFQSHLFEGSKRIIELADKIEEIPTICWCGKKARYNARIQDGKVVTDGAECVLGGNDTYTALCRKHYFEKNLGNKKSSI